jgi:DNA polymerase
MKLITIDFETYYDKEFSLSKMTTEEYIRDSRFEVIGVGVKVNDEDAQWFSGTREEIRGFLEQYDWHNAAAVAHNAMFDAAILTWVFGIKPNMWVDTLSLARAIDGLEVSGSLKAAAERHGLGVKGTEVVNALALRRQDFHPEQLARYGEYCKNDCDLTRSLLDVYIDKVSALELQVINLTIKMFSQPVLELDLPLLEQHLEEVRERKAELLAACEADPETLNSNPKFAELLRTLGVEPPMKVSLTTGKETFAFAKTDEGLKTLLDHEDERVQAVVAARLGTKSTLEETRTERFIEIAKRGPLPVPLRYFAAHTGRWGGSDKLNLQNLPRKGKLKEAIIPPKGYVIIDSDSSQIEARVLAWVAGQNDLVQAFANRHDVYKIMASKIYRKPVEEISDRERFMGKTTILGCGYGLGALKFQSSLKIAGVNLELEECQNIIKTYRETYSAIPELWKQAWNCLNAILEGNTCSFGFQPQAVYVGRGGFTLPSGYVLGYPELKKETGAEDGGWWSGQFSYKTRNGRTKIYGGKVVENLIQAVARCVIAEQMVWIAERYRPILTVHDAIAIVAPEAEAEEAQAWMAECMSTPPHWAGGLPLSCDYGIGRNYGEC